MEFTPRTYAASSTSLINPLFFKPPDPSHTSTGCEFTWPAHRERIPESPPMEPDHKRELGKLSDIGFAFLNACDGDKAGAEAMLDNFIDLLFEGGALSTWRYRILLANIREGL